MGLKHTLAALILTAISLLTATSPASAVIDPLAVDNNYFGIHIIDDHDLTQAQELVNSSGGDWGYVTLVIPENDRDFEKWQRVFDQIRQNHLIPIVRLAATPENSHWKRPTLDQAQPWADFLNSLNWVIKNRYIILFNEPNHAKEWGGEIKPHEYAEVARYYAETLKSTSDDFFILPAGFDASAANTTDTMEISQYLKFIHAYDPEFFTLFDGWTSHSYPNPGFSSSPLANGKTSIRGYEWERSFLSQYGLSPNIPIFITETGWVHQPGQETQFGFYSAEEVAENFTTAYKQVWTDPNIVAITPFVLKYPQPPFDHFAWIHPDGVTPYPQYHTIKSLSKTTGKPVQIHRGHLVHPTIPDTLVTNSTYNFTTTWENTGQSIWTPESFSIRLEGALTLREESIFPISSTAPFEEYQQTIKLSTPDQPGIYQFTISLNRDDRQFGQAYSRSIRIIPPPSLIIRAGHWLKTSLFGDDFTLDIIQQDQVIKSISDISLTQGEGRIPEIRDVVPDQTYLFELKKPGYLPSSKTAVLKEDITAIDFTPMFPLDLVPDNTFNYQDIGFLIFNPIKSLKHIIYPQSI